MVWVLGPASHPPPVPSPGGPTPPKNVPPAMLPGMQLSSYREAAIKKQLKEGAA